MAMLCSVTMAFYYLSNPYNGTEAEKDERADICKQVCFHFIRQGISVLSPIVHNHAMYKHPAITKTIDNFSVTERFEFIMAFDLNILQQAKAMLLLKLPGWEKSRGVAYEIEYCHEHNIPIIETDLESYQTLQL